MCLPVLNSINRNFAADMIKADQAMKMHSNDFRVLPKRSINVKRIAIVQGGAACDCL